MIVVDTNVLIYAVSERSPHHRDAVAWLTATSRGAQVLALPWVAMLGFLRIVTNPRVFPQPLPVDRALDVVGTWLAHPSIVVAEPTARHFAVLSGLLHQVGTAGNLSTDAHIAALAIEHGAAVATFDRDFGRFGVRVVVPAAL